MRILCSTVAPQKRAPANAVWVTCCLTWNDARLESQRSPGKQLTVGKALKALEALKVPLEAAPLCPSHAAC